MDKLIQTEKCSIIYGDFKGKPNQELFRCPRELDDQDLKRFVEESRRLIGFENDNATEDLHNVDGMELLDYWRMYYRGCWDGRWMGTVTGGYDDDKMTKLDCLGVQRIIDWVIENFPRGCSYQMQEYLEQNFKPWGNDNHRYLIKPMYSDLYKIMIDTTYGNGDYPVRIYAYKRKEN